MNKLDLTNNSVKRSHPERSCSAFRLLLQRRAFWLLAFFLVGFLLFMLSAWPFTVNLPTIPFEIGAGPCPPCQIDHTDVVVSIPSNYINVTVFFNSCTSLEYHTYVLLPFVASDVNATIYTPSKGYTPVQVNWQNLTEHRACIANASYNLDGLETFPELRMHITFFLHSNLEATNYWLGWNFLGPTRAAIMTFFGPRGKLGWPENVAAYEGRGLNTTLAIQTPLRVHINIPSGMYLSSETFPTPTQYYIRDKHTWMMFSLVFPDNNLAQTIACYFVSPIVQQWKNVLIFIGGASVGVGGSFIANLGEQKINEGKSESKRKERSATEFGFKEVIKKNFDKAYENLSLEELINAPISAISGISEGKAEQLNKALGIETVKELATNKYFLFAHAITRKTLEKFDLDKHAQTQK